MNQYGDFGKETEELMTICERNDRIPPELFKEFGVKRGLRDVDGTGVLAGISNISRIDAFKTEDGKKVPCDGQLWYRGYNVIDLIHGFEGSVKIVKAMLFIMDVLRFQLLVPLICMLKHNSIRMEKKIK